MPDFRVRQRAPTDADVLLVVDGFGAPAVLVLRVNQPIHDHIDAGFLPLPGRVAPPSIWRPPIGGPAIAADINGNAHVVVPTEQDVIANNLANVETAGFKRDVAMFQARYAEAIQQGSDYPHSRSQNDIGGGVKM